MNGTKQMAFNNDKTTRAAERDARRAAKTEAQTNRALAKANALEARASKTKPVKPEKNGPKTKPQPPARPANKKRPTRPVKKPK